MDAGPPSAPPGLPVDSAELLDVALGLGRAAGALLLDAVGRPRTMVASKSTPTDMVTEVDAAVERLISDGLAARRPDDALLGEEGNARDGTSGVLWVVDPIDGTTNFLYRLPGFAVSVAAVIDGEAVAAVVVDPVHGEEFTARRGGGAACNGQPIAPSEATDLGHALIGTGFSYDAERRRRQAGVLTNVLPAVRDIRRFGAASIDLCWVACGRLDAFYEKGLQPWDHAAGTLVVREAGGVVTDLDGGPPSHDFTLAATPALHGALGSLLDACGARYA